MKTRQFLLALVWLRAIWYFNAPHSFLHLPSLCRQWVLPCNLSLCVSVLDMHKLCLPLCLSLTKGFGLYLLHSIENMAWKGMRNTLQKSSTAFYKRRTYIAAPNCPTSTQSSRHYRDTSASYFQHLRKAFFQKWRLLPSCWLLLKNDYHIHTYTHILFWVRGMKKHIIYKLCISLGWKHLAHFCSLLR